jgi:hypothetical protein
MRNFKTDRIETDRAIPTMTGLKGKHSDTGDGQDVPDELRG